MSTIVETKSRDLLVLADSPPHIIETRGSIFLMLSYAAAQSRVKRPRRGLLRQLQMGLCVSGLSGNLGGRGTAAAGVDRARQSGRAAQRVGHAFPSRVLYRVGSQKHKLGCPKLGGAEQLHWVKKWGLNGYRLKMLYRMGQVIGWYRFLDAGARGSVFLHDKEPTANWRSLKIPLP